MWLWLRSYVANRLFYRRRLWPLALSFMCCSLILIANTASGQAQTDATSEEPALSVAEPYALPASAPQAPIVQPYPGAAAALAATAKSTQSVAFETAQADLESAEGAESESAESEGAESEGADDAAASAEGATPLSQYVLLFNRSPLVGNALQMEGILAEARLGFTRPQHWQVRGAKVQIRFRHSPALYAERSSLTVRLNNIHLGSIPLDRGADEIGNVLFEVPADAIQDYNTVLMQVQQHSSPECTDPTDPALWTEILPDSQVIIDYVPQAIALDLASYPYPFLNELGLDADKLTYLQPKIPSDFWMTAAARYQASAARLTNFRSVQVRLTEDIEDLATDERLIVIGTPTNQPLLAELGLPFAITDDQVLDGNGDALPEGVGVVMLATTTDNSNPVLVATGNDEQGVLKAVRALVQPNDRQLFTGQAVIVSEVTDIESPDPHDWPGFLPANASRFALSDLTMTNARPFQDTTVNGLPIPPPVTIPFKALPDEQFLRGSTFTLRYGYSPNVDPVRSSVSIRVNGQGIGGERLRNPNGGNDSITVDLPPDLMTPFANLEVQFFTYPKTSISCGDIPDQPMWGTVYGDSSFKLSRTNFVELPDLDLLKAGFPLTAPQDLANMTFVMPDRPSPVDLLTMLQTSSRLGRLSEADSVKLSAYVSANLPSDVREADNLVGIGTRDRFPLPELFDQSAGFGLGDQFRRRRDRTQIQSLPDEAGVITAAVSPWNRERILLGLTGQSVEGLENVQQVFYYDSLFAQLAGDTLLVQRRDTADAAVFRTDNFQVATLNQSAPVTIDQRGLLNRAIALLQNNWFLIPAGIILLALVLYGVSQLYLNRLSHSR